MPCGKGDHRGTRGKIIPEFHGMEERFLSGGLFRVIIFVYASSLLWSTGLFAQRVKVTDTIHWYNNGLGSYKGPKDAVWSRYKFGEKVQQVLGRVIPDLKVYIRYAPVRPAATNHVFKIKDEVFSEFREEYLLTLLKESYQRGNASIEDLVLAEFYVTHMRYLMRNYYVMDSVRISLRQPFKINNNIYNVEVSYRLLCSEFKNRVFEYGKEYYYVRNGVFLYKYVIMTSLNVRLKDKIFEKFIRFKQISSEGDSGNFYQNSRFSPRISDSVIDTPGDEF